MTEKSISKVTWMSVEEASRILGVSPVNLRRKFEARARRGTGGVIEATIDGARARKWGRLWRIALDAGWLEPNLVSEGAARGRGGQ